MFPRLHAAVKMVFTQASPGSHSVYSTAPVIISLSEIEGKQLFELICEHVCDIGDEEKITRILHNEPTFVTHGCSFKDFLNPFITERHLAISRFP